MGRSKLGLTEERLRHVELVVGVISGVLALVSLLTSFPGDLQNSLLRNETEEAELNQRRAKALASGPQLYVSYLFLTGNRMETFSDESSTSEDSTTEPPSSKEAITLLSFPTIDTRLPYETLNLAGCRLGDTAKQSEAYLVVENHGTRAATGITLHADQLALAAPVLIREAATGGDDYVAKLRGAARKSSSATFMIPRPLTPGGGVRVPLWTNLTPGNRSNTWCVVSGSLLLPTSVDFVDPDLDTSTSMNVRRIQSPEILDYGIQVGG